MKSKWNQFQLQTGTSFKKLQNLLQKSSGKEIKRKLALNMECGLRQKK